MRMAEETHGEWWPVLPGGSRKVILILSLENRGPVCQVSREQKKKKNLDKGINENKDIIILLIILTVAFSVHCNE